MRMTGNFVKENVMLLHQFVKRLAEIDLENRLSLLSTFLPILFPAL